MSGKQDGSIADFPTTHWSLVARAGGEGARDALGDLLNRYLPAARAYLVRCKRVRPDRAEEILQDYVTEKVLEQAVVSRADPGKGRFRTFLLTTLDRYVIDLWRRERAGGRGVTSTAAAVDEQRDPAQATTTDVFDVEWARQVIAEAIRRMRAECETNRLPELWGLFDCRVLGPTLRQEDAPDYGQMINRFGFKSYAEATKVMTQAKRMYERCLRSVVGEYATGACEVDAEIADLRRILSSQ